MLFAAVESVPRDRLAQCFLCPASSSPVCAVGLMLMFQDWIFCVQQWGTPHKQWNRHAALTRCPLVSDCSASLWEPVVTWPGMSWTKGRGLCGCPLPLWSPQNPCSPGPTVLSLSRTHAKPLCTNALLLFQHAYTRISSTCGRMHYTHVHTHSRGHLCVHTHSHTAPIMHTCTATHMHNKHNQ